MAMRAEIRNNFAYVYRSKEQGKEIFLRNYPLAKNREFPDEPPVMYAVRNVDYVIRELEKELKNLHERIETQREIRDALIMAGG